MKKQINILFLLVFIPIFSFGQSFYINNPHEWSGWSQGVFKKADIEIEVKDFHAQIDLFLEISAEDGFFSPEEQVEASLRFKLPQGSMIVDSWLYIEDYISKGLLIDRWEAVQIYEDIVGRRQDPSILTKNRNNLYSLKVYPMLGDSTRTLKIRYLQPIEYKNESALIRLPVDILELSENANFNTNLKVLDNFDSKNVQLIGGNNDFSLVGNEYTALLDSNNLAGFIEIGNIPELEICKSEGAENNYYQLSVASTSPDSEGKNYVFLIDFDQENCKVGLVNVLSKLKEELLGKFTEEDKFQFVYPGPYLKTVFSEFKPFTIQNIEDGFYKLNNEYDFQSPYLPNFFAKIYDEIGDLSIERIFLASSSASLFGNEGQDAVKAIDKIMELMDDDIVPVSIIELQSKNYEWEYINNQYFRGNQFFYSLLTNRTFGNQYYYGYYNNVGFSRAFYNIKQPIEGFDLDVDISGGVAYGQYDNLERGKLFFGEKYYQIGKFQGDGDFEIDFLTFNNNNVIYNKVYKISYSDIPQCFEDVEQKYSGYKIMDLETKVTHNSDIKEIIDLSMEHRVLSRYTAFLCLEEFNEFTDTIEVEFVEDGGGNGDGDVVSTDDPNVYKEEIKSYPNPFIQNITISLSLNESVDLKDVSIRIFNMNGQLVEELNKIKITDKGIMGVWDTDLEKQMFIVKIQVKDKVWVSKIVKI